MSGPAQEVEVQLPALYPAQHAMVYARERYSIVEASTKAGKTFACIVWQLSKALRIRGEHWWIAPTSDVAGIAYKRVRDLIERSGLRIKGKNDSRQEIYFQNGALWRFRGSDNENSLYGEDVYSVVIDEASRCKEHTWKAARSLITATGGQLRAIGNVRGRRNWFWRLARKAQAAQASGSKLFKYTKLTAYDAVAGGVFAASEIADAMEVLPEAAFRSLFMAEAEDEGTNPFGEKHIAKAKQAELSTRPTVAFGVDVAKKRDWLVILGIDEEGRVTHFVRERFLDYPQIERLIVETCKDVPTCIDQTGVGESVFDHCRLEMENLTGYIYTGPSRVKLYDDLAHELQYGRIGILDDGKPGEPGIHLSEFEAMEFGWSKFGKDYETSAEHDDTVAASALAVQAKKIGPRPKPTEPGVIETRTKARRIGAGGW